MEENKKEIVEIEKTNDTQNTKIEENETKEPKKERKGFCIASLVLGIVAIVFFCIWYISIPCGVLAVIFGILGIKSTNKGMAIAGLITGAIGLVVSTVIVIIIFMVALTVGISDSFDEIEDSTYRSYYNYY